MRAMTAPDTFLSNSIKVFFFILISSKYSSSGEMSSHGRQVIRPCVSSSLAFELGPQSCIATWPTSLAACLLQAKVVHPPPRSDRAIGSLVAHGGYRRHLVEHIELLKSQSAPRVVRGSGDF